MRCLRPGHSFPNRSSDAVTAQVANLVDYLYLYYCSESPWRDLALLLIIVVLST